MICMYSPCFGQEILHRGGFDKGSYTYVTHALRVSALHVINHISPTNWDFGQILKAGMAL